MAVVAALATSGIGILATGRLAGDEPFRIGGYQAMCDKPRPFPQAAARTPAPPRPVYVDGADLSSAGDLRVWGPTDPATVQVVACVTTDRGEYAGECAYRAGRDGPSYTETYYGGIYTISVYEASSGRLLGRTGRIRTSGGPPGGCRPNQALPGGVDEDRSHELLAPLAPVQWHQALDPYVLK